MPRHLAYLSDAAHALCVADGRYVQESGPCKGDTSFMTVMIYLNTPARGGETNFLNSRDESQISQVKPRSGLALVFDHHLLHEGARLDVGVKYAIRTDIMFRKEQAAPTPTGNVGVAGV